MKKKIISWLSFMTVFVFLLQSCIRDEFTNPENSSQNASSVAAKYTSKSPWKEDEVYINKVQQVFLKHANLPRVNETYGELHWEYAMSFGQFGERYALVPIVKDNKVVLLMEAVRKESKVYFYEKTDANLLQFFNYLLYSPTSDYNETINGADTAGKAKYVCTTRTLIVGCPPEIPDCTPITSSQTVCEWQADSGSGTPPKGFDPLGDPFSGGGGGGGYDYLDPPQEKTPCEKINEIGKHNTTKNLFENLKSKTNSTKEYGEILQGSGGNINNTSIEGEIGQGGIDLNFSGGQIDGFIHSHYVNLLSVFSPGDLASLAALYANGNIKDINTFIMGVVTASNTQYIMVIDDPTAFAAFAQQFLLPNGQIDDKYTDIYGTTNYQIYNIKNNNVAATNELGFIKFLNDKNSGIKVLKGSNNSNSWSELTIKNGQIDSQPCN